MAADTLTLESFSTGFSRPLVLTHADDDSGRVFIVEQSGSIHIVENGVRQATPFLDISGQVAFGGERGLLGLAFHPDYAVADSDGEGKFYVYYSAPSLLSNHQSVISQFSVSAADPDRANVASESIVLSFEQPFSNHNGGDLAFGPDDGMLYISSGDGGSGGDPLNNGQDGSNLLGGIMRIDVNGDDFPADLSRNYAIPNDNPFVGDSTVRDEWFATGLRNPYRMSFDDGPDESSSPDRLFTGDVGQSAFEEVNLVQAGQNYGWNVCEGDHVYNNSAEDCPDLYAPPIAEYGRDDGFSVIGGYVYRGNDFPAMRGTYLFGDFGGSIMALDENPDGSFTRSFPTVEGNVPASISGFGQDQNGELYLLSFAGIYSIGGNAGSEIRLDEAATITIRRDSDELIVDETTDDGDVEIFRSELGQIASLRIVGSAGDDRIVLDTVNPEVINKIDLDAGDGFDRISFSASVNVATLSSVADLLDTIEEIDLAGPIDYSLSVQSSDLASRSNSQPLRIRYDENDALELVGAWDTLQPSVVNEGDPVEATFLHRVESNTRELQLESASPYSNPIDPFDVSRDINVSAFDALLVINVLGTLGGTLEFPSPVPDPFRYFDVSGDNQLSALDALLVINEIARRSNSSPNAELAPIHDQIFPTEDEDDQWLSQLF